MQFSRRGLKFSLLPLCPEGIWPHFVLSTFYIHQSHQCNEIKEYLGLFVHSDPEYHEELYTIELELLVILT